MANNWSAFLTFSKNLSRLTPLARYLLSRMFPDFGGNYRVTHPSTITYEKSLSSLRLGMLHRYCQLSFINRSRIEPFTEHPAYCILRIRHNNNIHNLALALYPEKEGIPIQDTSLNLSSRVLQEMMELYLSIKTCLVPFPVSNRYFRFRYNHSHQPK